MQYGNLYKFPQDVPRRPVQPGGVCKTTFFKWEDVAVWPPVDPQTGTITGVVQLHPGKSFFNLVSIDRGRVFSEVEKTGPAGPYLDIDFSINLAGFSQTTVLALGNLMHHHFGVILRDRSGMYRLMGGPDAGAVVVWDYTSGDGGSSRRTTLKFSWMSPLPCPIYGAVTTGGTPQVNGEFSGEFSSEFN